MACFAVQVCNYFLKRDYLPSAHMHERVLVVVRFVSLCTADLEGCCITAVETGTNMKKMMI